jgi:hypothetical protein
MGDEYCEGKNKINEVMKHALKKPMFFSFGGGKGGLEDFLDFDVPNVFNQVHIKFSMCSHHVLKFPICSNS